MFKKVMDALVNIQQLNKSFSHFWRGHSFFFQGERINVVAADVAKQQRCVRRIQPKPKPKNPPCEMNIPQIGNALCRAILGANPNYAPIIPPDLQEVNKLAIRRPLGVINKAFERQRGPMLRLDVEEAERGKVGRCGDKVSAIW
jgi:hypothetical protein